MLGQMLDGRTFGVGRVLRGRYRGERRFPIVARLSLRARVRSLWVFLLARALHVEFLVL